MTYLDGAENERDAVFQAIGAASVCWEHMEGTGVFQDDKAREIAEELMDNWMKLPRLGYATTKALIDELAARADVSALTGEEWPNYTTVAVP